MDKYTPVVRIYCAERRPPSMVFLVHTPLGISIVELQRNGGKVRDGIERSRRVDEVLV